MVGRCGVNYKITLWVGERKKFGRGIIMNASKKCVKRKRGKPRDIKSTWEENEMAWCRFTYETSNYKLSKRKPLHFVELKKDNLHFVESKRDNLHFVESKRDNLHFVESKKDNLHFVESKKDNLHFVESKKDNLHFVEFKMHKLKFCHMN